AARDAPKGPDLHRLDAPPAPARAARLRARGRDPPPLDLRPAPPRAGRARAPRLGGGGDARARGAGALQRAAARGALPDGEGLAAPRTEGAGGAPCPRRVARAGGGTREPPPAVPRERDRSHHARRAARLEGRGAAARARALL